VVARNIPKSDENTFILLLERDNDLGFFDGYLGAKHRRNQGESQQRKDYLRETRRISDAPSQIPLEG